jgi:hypothetical protein
MGVPLVVNGFGCRNFGSNGAKTLTTSLTPSLQLVFRHDRSPKKYFSKVLKVLLQVPILFLELGGMGGRGVFNAVHDEVVSWWGAGVPPD